MTYHAKRIYILDSLMEARTYFKLLSILFGAIMVLKLPMVHAFPKQWNRFELGVAYTKEKPRWVWLVGGLGVGLILVTWYIYLISRVAYALLPTILLTITLIKIFQLLFRYQQFRSFAEKVTLKDRHFLLWLNVATLFIGLVLLYVGLFLL